MAAANGEAVVIASGIGLTEAFTGSVNVAPAWLLAESVTMTVKPTGPAVGGVPVSTPAELTVSHDGSCAPVQV